MYEQTPLHLKKWLDIKELEIEYGFAKSTQSKMRKEKTIPFSKVGGNVRYSRIKIDEWLEKHNIEMVGA